MYVHVSRGRENHPVAHGVENRCAAPARTLRGHVSLFISGARRAGRDHVLLIQERYERPHAAAPRSCRDRWPAASTVSFRFCVAHATRHTRQTVIIPPLFPTWRAAVSWFQLSNDRQLTRIGNTRGNSVQQSSTPSSVPGMSRTIYVNFGMFWQLHVHTRDVWIIN